MALGPGPLPGDDVDLLWRHVRELYEHVRALERLTVVVNNLNINGNTVSGHGTIATTSAGATVVIGQ